MGLEMTIGKEKNNLHFDFVDAYWSIDNITYTPTVCDFLLRAYPTRDAKLMNGHIHENPSFGFGGSDPLVSSVIYTWNGVVEIKDLFPNGIPLSPDEQKTALYNWVKAYTQLPFTDVFE